jgi:hypothetical protein
MSYGELYDQQRVALVPYIKGTEVYDLGAGNLKLSHELIHLGASAVNAIDKEHMPAPLVPGVKTFRKTFAAFQKRLPDGAVVFLSWPPNHEMPELWQLLRRAEVIIYLGKNTDGRMCGTPALFKHLLTRRLDEYVPHGNNSMIVYGPATRFTRAPVGEEYAALKMYEEPDRIYGFEEVEAECEPSF